MTKPGHFVGVTKMVTTHLWRPTMTTRPLCIYHANCADGFAAAWVVKKALHSVVDFHPGVYGEAPPDVTGRDVILVDFSYKRPVIEQLIATAGSVTILDHHLSAKEDLEDLSGAIVVFDLHRCGAMIAWRYFFPNYAAPRLLLHIQDRDLWRFVLEGSREIALGLFSHPYDFDLWDDFMSNNNVALTALRSDGEALSRKQRKDIDELLPLLTRRLKIGGFDVPAANLPYMFASDAGHILAKGEPFAATYFDTGAGRTFSLRSHAVGEDVSKIAALYGGGGHRNAAGFRVDRVAARFMEDQS